MRFAGFVIYGHTERALCYPFAICLAEGAAFAFTAFRWAGVLPRNKGKMTKWKLFSFYI